MYRSLKSLAKLEIKVFLLFELLGNISRVHIKPLALGVFDRAIY